MKEGLRKVLAPISPRVFGSYLDISLSIFVWVAEYFSTLVIWTPTRTREELVKGRTAPWMPLCGESWPTGSSSFAHWNHFFIGKESMNSSSDTVGTQDGQPKKVNEQISSDVWLLWCLFQMCWIRSFCFVLYMNREHLHRTIDQQFSNENQPTQICFDW